MAKRRFKNKKVRYVAIGAAIMTGAAVATVLLPSANAADETPDEIMAICQRAREINGEKRSLSDFDAEFGEGFRADTCDFEETNFEIFDGPTEKVTVEFPNCEPNATEPSKVRTEWATSVVQGKGTYKITQNGGGGGILGFLSASWQKHKGTLDLTLNEAAVSESEEREVPVGKVLHMEFTPKMQRMTGIWRVHTPAREGNGVVPGSPEVNLEAEEVVEGPVILEDAAGAPGRADGTIKAVVNDC